MKKEKRPCTFSGGRGAGCTFEQNLEKKDRLGEKKNNKQQDGGNLNHSALGKRDLIRSNHRKKKRKGRFS